MLPYRLRLRFSRSPAGNLLWRWWNGLLGRRVGDYQRLPGLVREYAPTGSFADVGCMWGVDGEYAFVAEEAGATRVVGIDIFGPTPEFDQKKDARDSKVEFILGDVTDPNTLEQIGVLDVVLCAGVLYHHPSPFDVLVALRRICRRTLILRTSTIPEVPGLKNAAVYYPWLPARERRRWDLSSLGVGRQVGITGAFEPEAGYGNWFWGITPSCLESLLRTAGFEIESREVEPFAQTVICRAVDVPFSHRLPGEAEARAVGERISTLGEARPS